MSIMIEARIVYERALDGHVIEMKIPLAQPPLGKAHFFT